MIYNCWAHSHITAVSQLRFDIIWKEGLSFLPDDLKFTIKIKLDCEEMREDWVLQDQS